MENINIWGFVLVMVFGAIGAIGEGLAQWWVKNTEFDRAKFYNSVRRSIISCASSTPLGFIPNLPVACLVAFLAGASISIGVNKSKDNL